MKAAICNFNVTVFVFAGCLFLAGASGGCFDLGSLTRGDAGVDGGVLDAAAPAPADLAVAEPPDDLAVAVSSCAPGSVCQPAPDVCHSDALCDDHGVCRPPSARPDGYGYDSSNPLSRCCGGKPVAVDSAQNCGACGIDCGARPCLYTHGPHYFCGCASDGDCWSQCCSTAYGLPDVCAAGDCATNQPIACPGNAILSDDALGPYYCHY